MKHKELKGLFQKDPAEYAREYQRTHAKDMYDRVNLRLPKGKKAVWQKAAEEHDMNLTEYIIYKVED